MLSKKLNLLIFSLFFSISETNLLSMENDINIDLTIFKQAFQRELEKIDKLHELTINELKKKIYLALINKEGENKIIDMVNAFVENLPYKKPNFDFLNFMKEEQIEIKNNWNQRWANYLGRTPHLLQYTEKYPTTYSNEEEQKARTGSLNDKLRNESLSIKLREIIVQGNLTKKNAIEIEKEIDQLLESDPNKEKIKEHISNQLYWHDLEKEKQKKAIKKKMIEIIITAEESNNFCQVNNDALAKLCNEYAWVGKPLVCCDQPQKNTSFIQACRNLLFGRNIDTVEKNLINEIGLFKNKLQKITADLNSKPIQEKLKKIFSPKNFTNLAAVINQNGSVKIKNTNITVDSSLIDEIDWHIKEKIKRELINKELELLRQKKQSELNEKLEVFYTNRLQLCFAINIEEDTRSLINQLNELCKELNIATTLDPEQPTEAQQILATYSEKQIRNNINNICAEINSNKINHEAIFKKTTDTFKQLTLENKPKHIDENISNEAINFIIQQNISENVEKNNDIIVSVWQEFTNLHNSNYFESAINWYGGSWKSLEKFKTNIIDKLIHQDKNRKKHDNIPILEELHKKLTIAPRENPLNVLAQPAIATIIDLSFAAGMNYLTKILPNSFDSKANKQIIKQYDYQIKELQEETRENYNYCKRQIQMFNHIKPTKVH